MGVPKFFRYMSERYPCLSESVKEYQIPMFDNLYLDMNGIIHMCSHPDDNNPHFRITEEKLFSDIFHYIEVLFQMIKPQKVFFMAVDGVAPRAKMNQQRGRRFRSAKDAEKMEAEAIKKGEKLPEVSRFDSNCITPGTEFMAKLHEQLKYFVVKKVSTEKAWQKCKIILSGHETPGEGEHKIMDYIRYSRSQPGYDPNTRHCLYGLDADLIMLGLCTHEPHFSLLREEVKFGRKSTKRNNVPEEIRFYLLHLSLMREYLELEFSPLKSKLKDHATIKFDIEKIIDDWVLMGFLVGNDFIPHLPNLHINEDALPKLYKAYMEVLPQLDGYINEAGSLNLQRFEILVRQLSSMDLEHFEECKEDLMYMEAKTGRKAVAHVPVSTNPDKQLDEEIGALDIKGDDEFLEALSSSEVEESSDDDDDDQDEFKSFKDEYYRNKLEYQKVTKEVMRDQAEGYVRAIQWNLNYYYNGCCSWSWYYPHHYAPYVSDVRNFSNLDIKFDLGEPFKPFEQLLAVLPAASKQLLPKPYHALMTDEESKLKKYYPTEFQTDLNGKKQDWEAVVLVPFIDENILLDAMKTANDQLTQEEKDRNTHGPMLIYEYTRDDLGVYEAPAYFSSVQNHAQCTPIHIKDIRVPEDKLIKGAYPGARFDVFYPGFPTMKHLNYKGELRKAKVKVFEYPSRNENMILTIIPPSDLDNENLPIDLLGRHVFVGWPHLVEAKVIAVSNKNFKCTLSSTDMKHVEKVQNNEAVFASEVEGITDKYFKSMGVDFGKITTLVHVRTMVGRRYVFTANGRVSLDKQFNPIPSAFPIQGIVKDIKVHDDYHSTFREITEVFTPGSVCFTLSNPHYGSMGKILDSSETLRNGRLKVELTILKEPDLTEVQNANAHLSRDYYDLYAATNHVAISSYVFSRITGSLYVKAPNVGDPKMINLGLDLKFNKRNQETPGYTKNIDGKWMYSMKAIELVKTYIEKFPELFFYLSRNIDHKQELHAYAIFDGEAEQKIKEIQTWLKSLPTHSMERRNCDSSVLDNDTIAQIEKIVEEFTAQPQNPRTMVLQLRPQLLYKPELQIGNLVPDPFTKTQVFDRIVNVRDSYVVPLGLKGTVVAVQKLSTSKASDNDEVYDVVFDEPFNGGLAAACKKNREFRLSRNSLINLSHGLRGMEERTGRPGARLAQARATLGQPGTNGQNILPTMFPSFAADNNRAPRPQQQQHYPQQGFAQRHTTQQQSQSNSAFVPVAAATPPVFQVNPVVNSNRLESIPANQNFPTRPSIGSTQQQRQQQQQQQPIVRSIVPTQKTSPSSSTTTGSSLNAAASFLASGNKQSPPSGVPSKARKENSASNFALPQQANIDTDFLKRLLKINNDENRLIDNSTAPQSPRRTIDTTSELKYPKQATRDMSQQQPTTTTSATAQLLNYYQLNNLGLPRYNYMNTSPNYYASQIVLPDKKVIIGEQARTRAEASENVASKALEVLKANETVGQAVLPVFPEPPEKWVVGQNWQASQQSSSSGRSPQKHPSPDGSRNRNFAAQNPHHPSNVVLGSTSTAAPTTNSFVPLQAVIKHSNKKQHQQQQSHQHSTTHQQQQQQQQQDPRPTLVGSGDNSSSNAQPKTDVPGSDNKDHSAPSEKQTNKSRQRKTRIAANFGSRQS